MLHNKMINGLFKCSMIGRQMLYHLEKCPHTHLRCFKESKYLVDMASISPNPSPWKVNLYPRWYGSLPCSAGFTKAWGSIQASEMGKEAMCPRGRGMRLIQKTISLSLRKTSGGGGLVSGQDCVSSDGKKQCFHLASIQRGEPQRRWQSQRVGEA